MKRLVILLSLVCLLLVACEDNPGQSAEIRGASAIERPAVTNYQGRAERPRATAKVDYVFYNDDLMKPAFDPNALLPNKALKADEYDNTRWHNPERYAITQAPKGNIRPMVEWEPMRSIVMQYPGGYSGYADVTKSFVDIARHSLTVAEVWFIVDGQQAINTLTSKLLEAGVTQGVIDTKLKFLTTQIDSIWFIDSGPLPIVDADDGSFTFADFRYYHQRPIDDGISTLLGRSLPALGQESATTTYRMPMNVEGGTFQATEDGICITGNRQLYYMSCDDGKCINALHGGAADYMGLDAVNAHPLANEMREIWADYAGCKDLIVTNSISDDGTGHIDMYLKILDDTRVLIGEYLPPFDAVGSPTEGTGLQALNAQRMDDNAAYLNAYTKPDGTNLEAVRLVMPGHRTTSDGSIPFTYANSTLINGLNLWPATEYPELDASRDQAQAQWDALLPEYENIWINATELSFWSGAIHCITRTIPAAPIGVWVGEGACNADDTCDAPADGYTGECSPASLQVDICWGPEWECACNDCETACDYDPGTAVDQCFGITYTGCCTGETSLVYCDGGNLAGGDDSCEGDPCGWDTENGWYDCGFEGADPSGGDPRSCEDVMEQAECEPVCDGKACGDDGCGGSCGDCAQNEQCDLEGACVAVCTDECADGETGCNGESAWSCAISEQGCLAPVSQDCAEHEKVCMSGICVDASLVPSQDAGPSLDAAITDIGPGDPGTVDGGSSSDSGCQGSGGAQPMWASLLALLALAGIRRRY
jgi:agmatine/peptidylarginine deiminase